MPKATVPPAWALGMMSAVLPVGRFSRTIGLFFSLRCGKFFAVAGCGFLG